MSRQHLEEQAQNWLREAGTTPPGNGIDKNEWEVCLLQPPNAPSLAHSGLSTTCVHEKQRDRLCTHNLCELVSWCYSVRKARTCRRHRKPSEGPQRPCKAPEMQFRTKGRGGVPPSPKEHGLEQSDWQACLCGWLRDMRMSRRRDPRGRACQRRTRRRWRSALSRCARLWAKTWPTRSPGRPLMQLSAASSSSSACSFPPFSCSGSPGVCAGAESAYQPARFTLTAALSNLRIVTWLCSLSINNNYGGLSTRAPKRSTVLALVKRRSRGKVLLNIFANAACKSS